MNNATFLARFKWYLGFELYYNIIPIICIDIRTGNLWIIPQFETNTET